MTNSKLSAYNYIKKTRYLTEEVKLLMDKFNDTDIMVLGVILKHGKENGASLNNGIVIDDILHVIKDIPPIINSNIPAVFTFFFIF